MKRHLLLSVATVAAIGTINAVPLSPEAALSRVKNESGQHKLVSKGGMELKMTRYVDQQPVIYLFSRGENSGFLAVSADDSSVPLLGYTDTGTFNGKESDLPDGLRYWLASLGEQVAHNEGVYSPRKVTKTDISPMTKTKWNQGAPYNDDCPELNGSRCVTGCVATALAQLLKYYSYPTKGIGTHSYDWSPGGETLSFDYGNTTFDWENMTDTYDENSTDVQKAAVAQLMYACGVGVNMNYTASESGAADFYVLRTLIENLGYDSSVQYLERDYYTLADWEDIVYDNLVNFGPVLYGGQSNDGGHEFICDGYQDGYFHFNWGWGGMSDGYFVLTALNPESQGIGGSTSGYDFSQDIIIHVQTGKKSDVPFEQILWEGDFTIDNSPVTVGNEIKFTGTFYNMCYEKIDGVKVGLLLTSSDGTETFITDSKGVDLSTMTGYKDATFTAKLPSSITPGTYKVQPAYTTASNSTPTVIPVKINNVGCYTMSVVGTTATFTAEEPASLTASDFTLDTPLYVGNDFKVSATLANTSADKEFYGEVRAVVIEGSNVLAAGDAMQVDLPAGDSEQWEYVSTLTAQSGSDLQSGQTYQLYLCTVKTASDDSLSLYPIAGPISVTVNESTSSELQVSQLVVQDMVGNNLTGSATVECTEGYFAGALTLAIFNASGGSSIATYSSNFFAVSAEGSDIVSNTATITFDATFNIGKPSTTYLAAIFKGQTQLGNAVTFKTGETTEVETIENSDDIVSSEYYTLSGIRLASRPDMPGIYVVRQQHSDGHVTTIKEAF